MRAMKKTMLKKRLVIRNAGRMGAKPGGSGGGGGGRTGSGMLITGPESGGRAGPDSGMFAGMYLLLCMSDRTTKNDNRSNSRKGVQTHCPSTVHVSDLDDVLAGMREGVREWGGEWDVITPEGGAIHFRRAVEGDGKVAVIAVVVSNKPEPAAWEGGQIAR